MEEMQRKGKLRSLGVSNFGLEDVEGLVQLATVPVSAVQDWFDPFHQDVRMREFSQKHGIRYIGYSTLGEYGGVIVIALLLFLPFFMKERLFHFKGQEKCPI